MWKEPQPKTTVFTQKPRFSNGIGAKAKNCGFWLKTVVFGWKPQFLAENCGFLCGFQMWDDPKTMVFSVVFKFGRSQSQKLWFSASKTAVFKSGRSLVENCSFQPKTAVFSLKNCGFQKWEEPSWKPRFSAKNCGFQPQKLRFSKVGGA